MDDFRGDMDRPRLISLVDLPFFSDLPFFGEDLGDEACAFLKDRAALGGRDSSTTNGMSTSAIMVMAAAMVGETNFSFGPLSGAATTCSAGSVGWGQFGSVGGRFGSVGGRLGIASDAGRVGCGMLPALRS